MPKMPFSSYRWFWACKTPTEALNDPAVLFGVLRIISFLGGRSIRYSSMQFEEQLMRLSEDVSSTVDLRRRVGERNLIRNSGQYWSALGLIPAVRHGGKITITDFGADVATGVISQGDFAALTIMTFALPNKATYSEAEIKEWESRDLKIYPLRLILAVMKELFARGEGWITPREVAAVIIPMAAEKRSASDMAEYVVRYRSYPEAFSSWPNCTSGANDMRFVREHLLFLRNYGYVGVDEEGERAGDRFDERYWYLSELDFAITGLVEEDSASIIGFGDRALRYIRDREVSAAVMSTVVRRRAQRPGQAQFRQLLLQNVRECPITNVDLPDVLEAAHIKPHAYGGSMGLDNGWPMRVDVHRLFDSGKLRIRPDGRYGLIEFTDDTARRNYKELANKAIVIPETTNLEHVQWRYDNYTVGMRIDE